MRWVLRITYTTMGSNLHNKEDKMQHYNRLLSLQNFHSQLERSIADEMRRPYPDAVSLKRLKLRKFAVRQEIKAFEELGQLTAANSNTPAGVMA